LQQAAIQPDGEAAAGEVAADRVAQAGGQSQRETPGTGRLPRVGCRDIGSSDLRDKSEVASHLRSPA
jgi:hypothetical protein